MSRDMKSGMCVSEDLLVADSNTIHDDDAGKLDILADGTSSSDDASFDGGALADPCEVLDQGIERDL